MSWKFDAHREPASQSRRVAGLFAHGLRVLDCHDASTAAVAGASAEVHAVGAVMDAVKGAISAMCDAKAAAVAVDVGAAVTTAG